nr:hypothetical protein GCM10020185_43650 [Pseudomonas brassicacearum subsp. brassicacearum]
MGGRPEISTRQKYGAEIDAVVNEIPERDRMNKGVYGDYAKTTKERIAKKSKQMVQKPAAESLEIQASSFGMETFFYQHKRYPNIGNDGLEELNDAQFWEDKIFMPGSYRETPAIHGLQMALEICAEHFIGATVLHKNNVLDFHILVSASIALDKARVGVKPGGMWFMQIQRAVQFTGAKA